MNLQSDKTLSPFENAMFQNAVTSSLEIRGLIGVLSDKGILTPSDIQAKIKDLGLVEEIHRSAAL